VVDRLGIAFVEIQAMPPVTTAAAEASSQPADDRPPQLPGRQLAEDWAALWLGIALLLVALLLVCWTAAPAGGSDSGPLNSWVSRWIVQPQRWDLSPTAALIDPKSGRNLLLPLLVSWGQLMLICCAGLWLRGYRVVPSMPAVAVLLALATIALILAAQQTVQRFGLEFAVWGLLLGLVISNSVGTPQWLRPAAQGELWIKLGLVLMGAEILFGRLLALGPPGIMVAWVVTPVVLISTYLFGQYVLRISSKTLNLVISADMSVCGVSAAIATAAACRAKREELSLAIGMSLSFTVVMMVVMPRLALAMGLSPAVGGAWIGGTIDSTGAVAAAGQALGETGLQVATTVKLIQNVMIGLVAFVIALLWSRGGEGSQPAGKVGWGEIWIRFPKFILGFLGLSLLFSFLAAQGGYWSEASQLAVSGLSKPWRNWLFCLAFVAIGLQTDFRQLAPALKGGKPLTLYLCGQGLNLILTLAMAWLAFGGLADTAPLEPGE
jgi:uncharacterized integral membrane protein (TIGR00698 family)